MNAYEKKISSLSIFRQHTAFVFAVDFGQFMHINYYK